MARVRVILIALISVALVGSSMGGTGLAAGNYQCDAAGGNAGIVNACGARWEAANIRAHISRGDFQPYRASCLARAADRLDALASQWAEAHTYTRYTGAWPCGTRPRIDDDGALAAACPQVVWSYANRGLTNCRPRIAQSAPPPPPTQVSQSAPVAQTSPPVQIVQPPPQAPQAYAPPASGAVIRVGRAVSSEFAFAALEVGVDAHIWDRVGLKLEIVSFRGDAQVQQAMTAGAVDFGLGSGPAMGYHAKGVPAIAVASMYGPPTDMAIVVASNGNVKSVADLRGKKIGVTTAGSFSDWLVHELARRQGWGSNGIDAVPMGSVEARVAALESGQIVGSVQDIGDAYNLEAQGNGKVFQTFGSFVPNFETHVIFATDDMIAKHPDIVQRFLKGWFMTVAYMGTHKAEAVRSIAPVLGESGAIAGRQYDNDMSSMSTTGAWDPAAVQAVAQSIVDLGLSVTIPDPKAIYSSQFVPVKI